MLTRPDPPKFSKNVTRPDPTRGSIRPVDNSGPACREPWSTFIMIIYTDQNFTSDCVIDRENLPCISYYQLHQPPASSCSEFSINWRLRDVLVHAYCNSLFAGVSSDELVNRIQSVLRQPARLRKRKFDPVSIDLRLRERLHWLPILQRIQYKFGLLVYKWLHGLAGSIVGYLSATCLHSEASFQLFLGGANFFLFFNATGYRLLKNWKKQHIYM